VSPPTPRKSFQNFGEKGKKIGDRHPQQRGLLVVRQKEKLAQKRIRGESKKRYRKKKAEKELWKGRGGLQAHPNYQNNKYEEGNFSG